MRVNLQKKMQSKFPNATHVPVLKLMFFHLLFASYTAIVKEAELLWMLWYVFGVVSDHSSL